ncbi:hypothetical protein GCM10027035_22050 [Emticicia sediminis]
MKQQLLFLLLFPLFVNAQFNAKWADEVLFSDNLSTEQLKNYAKVLGKPDSKDLFSDKSCTFAVSSLNWEPIQSISVSFAIATEARQLVIAQNYFSGAIKNVIVFDSLGNKKNIYAASQKAIVEDNYAEFLGIDTPKKFKIKAVEIIVDLNNLGGKKCQIDAVGLLIDQKFKDIEYASYLYCVRSFNPDINDNQHTFLRKAYNNIAVEEDSVINDGLVNYISQYKIQWAEEDATASSGRNSFARNVLGKPIFYRAKNVESSWQPKPNTPDEWVKVTYVKPQTIKDIFVFMNINEQGFDYIELLDSKNTVKEKIKFNDSRVLFKEFRTLWHLHLQQLTTYEVSSIRLITNQVSSSSTSVVQIDAIGIANESEKINEVAIKANEVITKENIGRTINTPTKEIAPLVSFDGKTLFFVREGHKDNTGIYKLQDVWMAKMGKKGWQQPINLGLPINTNEHNAISMISPNAKTLYLINVYESDGRFRQGLSVSHFEKNSYTFPKEVKIDNYYSNSSYTEFSIAPNRRVMILAVQRKDTQGQKDLYVSFLKQDGTWSNPVNMGKTINTVQNESAPFIAADNRTIYFSTKGFLGYGDNDIFMTERLDDTWLNWSKPINLGATVNTSAWDGYFCVTAAGDYAYTSSETKSIGAEDIFRVKLPVNARPKPVVIISGKVEGSASIQKFEAVEIENGKEIYLADYDPETKEYLLILPTGKKYNLNVVYAQGNEFKDVLDLSTFDNYTEISKDVGR